jgi:hypothetical protein
VSPVEAYLDERDQRWHTDTTTIIILESVVGTRSLANLLHGQSAVALTLALLDRADTVMTSVPFVADAPGPAPKATGDAPPGRSAPAVSGRQAASCRGPW